ncbi:reverse transcriptase [Canna indica]|uniref:Reverse transcriptase n=1 Tax=Canna indica TaxID=4628 RepID=A0AAQ3L1E9_9LILI|nr:reverse transcriptase [Canna indica]
MEEMNRIHRTGQVPNAWTETMLAKISKVEKPKKITELRPIALCKVIYKIFAKMLVNRFRKNLCEIIGQKINLHKSEVFYPEKVKDETKHMVEQILKIKKGKYPMKYLEGKSKNGFLGRKSVVSSRKVHHVELSYQFSPYAYLAIFFN